MISLLEDTALLQHKDVVRMDHISQAMRNKDHGLCLCQVLDHFHDLIFTFHINI